MKKIGLILLPVVIIILEMLPSGAVLLFAPSPTEIIRQTYSYFSLKPLMYTNFAPFITAILTCLILFFTIIIVIRKKKEMAKMISGLSIAAAIVSLMPLVFGAEHYSFLGVVITVLLIIEFILSKLVIENM